MLYSRWLICPVVSLLVLTCSGRVLAQTQWIELGRNDIGIVKLNSRIDSLGSVVMYELLIQLDKPTDGISAIKTRIIARCQSKSQAVSSSEGLDSQGRIVRSNTVADADLVWRTPQSDVYGRAFQMVCEGR